MAKNNNKNKNKVSNSVVIGMSAAAVTTGILTVLTMQIFKTEPIVVAARDIEAFQETPLIAEDFITISVSAKNKKDFEGFVDNVSSLVGTIPTTNISQNQPVKRSQFIDINNAEEVQSIVSNGSNRGIYLPIKFTDVLSGDLRIGSSVDLYILTDKPQPTVANPDGTVKVLIPFQMSFRVEKMKMSNDTDYLVFFDFPMEESEQYLFLKEQLQDGKAKLVATMPNLIHKSYDGEVITEDKFENALLSTQNYFSKINKEDLENESNVDVSVGVIVENVAEEDKENTVTN